MVKVGLVGCGFMGAMHANVYSVLEGASLVGVWDVKPERAAEFVGKWGGTAYESYGAMLSDPSVDAVDVCLPTDAHAEFSIAACRAGKHVMCEKPMALSLADADAMCAAAREAGVKMMVGHCIRFWPEYEELKRIVDSGSLGRMLSLNLTRYGAFPAYTVDKWAADVSKAGGGMDMHIHDTDFALYLLGEPKAMHSFGSRDERGVGHFFSVMDYGSAVVHLEGGWNFPQGAPFRMEFRTVFEKGAAIYRDGELWVYEEGSSRKFEAPKMKASGAGGNLSSLGGYYNELAYFVECVASDRAPTVVTPESSRESLRWVLEEVRQIEERLGR
jgi:predicted dehydrogenase